MSTPPPPPYGSAAYGAPAAAGELAGFWRRFVAWIIDAIIIGIIGAIIGAVINAIIHASGVDTGYYTRSSLIQLVIGLVYFGYLWSAQNGQTLGYMAMGLRLVKVDGSPITFGFGALRYFLIWLQFLICLIPAIVSAFMIGLGSQKTGIHDAILSTRVVRA